MGKLAGILLTGLMVAAGAASAMAAVGDRNEGRGMKRGGERGETRFLKRLDADNDLAVTLDEYLKKRSERFVRTDKNSDGVLDEAELLKGSSGRGGNRMEQLLRRFDQDNDGRLTKAEFEREPSTSSAKGDGPGRFAAARSPERRQRMFQLYDRNSDGVVEKAEYDAAKLEEQEYRRKKALHVLDRNSDGRVTLEEYTADARFRFERLDLDRDGRITATDLPPMVRWQWSQR